MYELLDQHRMFQPSCLDDFKNLKDLLDRFEVRESERSEGEGRSLRDQGEWAVVWFQALEKIAAYMKSDRFMKTPVNNKMARWGNKKE